MSTYRFIDRVCAIVTVLSLIVTILFMNGEKLGIVQVQDADAESYTGNEYFTENDLNGSWDTSEATVITLSGDSGKISGKGAYWLNRSLVIAQSGRYVISGELTDGNIIVNAERYSMVFIQLNGVNLTCSEDACIRVDQADKVFLTLAEGTENTLTGPAAFSETALADGTNGVIFSHDDLTINGSGALTVVAALENGITSKDDLKITGGTISVTAPNHGLRVNDHFCLTAANVTIEAEQDGIHSEGDIVMSDGTLTITAGDDAIHSDTSFLIQDGVLLVKDCYEGIEAVTIEIAGGDVTIHSQDDGINANGNTGNAMGGGMGGGMGMQRTFGGPMQAFDEGETPDPDMARETPETAAAVTESTPDEAVPDAGNGTAEPPAQGIGPMQEGTFRRGGMGNGRPMDQAADSAATEEQTIVSVEDTWIRISGGTLTILNENGRDADGIDSNGNIIITGGQIRVSLAGNSGNNALDVGSESGGKMTISGGTIIACGDSAMAESFESESAQASILYTLGESAPAGSTVTLLDAAGNELISGTAPYSFSALVISCPEMNVGETYTIRIGETEETVELTSTAVTAGERSGFGMGGGNRMHGNHENGQMPPAFLEGMEPPENMGNFQPMGGFGPREMETDETGASETATEEAAASAENQGTKEENPFGQIPEQRNFPQGETAEMTAQAAAADQTAAGPLVIASVLCLILGLAVAFRYRKSLNMDA